MNNVDVYKRFVTLLNDYEFLVSYRAVYRDKLQGVMDGHCGDDSIFDSRTVLRRLYNSYSDECRDMRDEILQFVRMIMK